MTFLSDAAFGSLAGPRVPAAIPHGRSLVPRPLIEPAIDRASRASAPAGTA